MATNAHNFVCSARHATHCRHHPSTHRPSGRDLIVPWPKTRAQTCFNRDTVLADRPLAWALPELSVLLLSRLKKLLSNTAMAAPHPISGSCGRTAASMPTGTSPALPCSPASLAPSLWPGQCPSALGAPVDSRCAPLPLDPHRSHKLRDLLTSPATLHRALSGSTLGRPFSASQSTRLQLRLDLLIQQRSSLSWCRILFGGLAV